MIPNDAFFETLDPTSLVQRLPELLDGYLQFCREERETQKKQNDRFPNLAGFCRWAGCGTEEFFQLEKSHPRICDRILTILEDEALNSSLPSSTLNAYLKQRLWKDPVEEKTELCAGEQLRLVFEHDILEDGK